MSMRDVLRSKTVGASKTFKRVFVSLEEGFEVSEDRPEGDCVEVRAPSMKGKSKVTGLLRFKQGKDGAAEVIGDMSAQVAAAIVECCFEPGTDSRIYDEADIEAIQSHPEGGIFTALGTVAMGFISGVEAQAKKSETTQGA